MKCTGTFAETGNDPNANVGNRMLTDKFKVRGLNTMYRAVIVTTPVTVYYETGVEGSTTLTEVVLDAGDVLLFPSV